MIPQPPSNSNIVFKIQNGTTKSTGSLCRTCSHAQIIRGNANQQIIKCFYGRETVMNFEVAECNKYEDASKPDLYSMEEIAWRLVTKPGKPIGFLTPKDFKKLQKEEGRELS